MDGPLPDPTQEGEVMAEYDPREDEVDVVPFEGEPDFELAPWLHQTDHGQDEV
jgi:hypothetical protein